jgi:hypothetical protein
MTHSSGQRTGRESSSLSLVFWDSSLHFPGADKDPLEMSKGKKRVEACLAIFAYGSPILFIVAVVLNETYLLHSPSLPLGEAPHSVGQWGCWVATILVLMSTLLDKTSAPAKTGDTFASVGAVPSVTVPTTTSSTVVTPPQISSDEQEEDEKLEVQARRHEELRARPVSSRVQRMTPQRTKQMK